MKPSKYIRQKTGLSLKQVADNVDQSEQTLINWYNNPKKRKVFEACVYWAKKRV